MHVALFVPCYIDQFYPHVAIATLRLLERLGCTVTVPTAATCCGQPMANAGMEPASFGVVRRFVQAVAAHEADHVVIPSGSCAYHVTHHHAALDLGAEAAVAEDVRARTYELCAFLHDVVGLDAVAELGAVFPRWASLHIGCHALRGLGLARPSEHAAPPFDKVRALLATVGGLDLAAPARADECCGFGGTFAVAEPELSAKIGRDRLRDLTTPREGSGPVEAVISTDVSCTMHLEGLARRAGHDVRFLHVAEVLAAPAQGTAEGW